MKLVSIFPASHGNNNNISSSDINYCVDDDYHHNGIIDSTKASYLFSKLKIWSIDTHTHTCILIQCLALNFFSPSPSFSRFLSLAQTKWFRLLSDFFLLSFEKMWSPTVAVTHTHTHITLMDDHFVVMFIWNIECQSII